MSNNLITLVIPTTNKEYKFVNTQIDKNFDVIIEYDENKTGAGETRNRALEKVTTPYVVFMDDDDMLSPVAIQIFNKVIKEEAPQVIFGKVTRSFKDGKLLEDIGTVYSTWTWLHGKCYSMKFLNDNNIRFKPGIRYNEDVDFNNFIKLYANPDRIFKVETIIYYFMYNDNSTCANMYRDIEKRKKERLDAIESVYHIAPLIKDDEMAREQLYRFYQWTNKALALGVDERDIPNALPILLKRKTDYKQVILKFTQYATDDVSGDVFKCIPWEEFKEKFKK